MHARKYVYCLSSAIGALLLAGGAQAQSDSAAGQLASGGGEQTGVPIIVTAARREQGENDVAATLDVLTSDELTTYGTDDTLALQYVTTGLTISRDQAINNIYIRGIGSSILGIATGNSVATYLDGAFIANSVQVFQPFNDVERIEVLKGPQATLYGRNATGGAINIITRTPEFLFGASADLSFGNYDAFTARASINVPLATDTAAARLSIFRTRHDGYTNNLLGGRNDGEDRWGVRGAFRLALGDTADLVIRGDYSESDGSEGGLRNDNPLGRYYTAPLPIFPPATFISNPRQVQSDLFENELHLRDAGVNATLTLDVGIGELRLVSSYRDFHLGPQVTDLDGTEFNVITLEANEVDSDSFYNELVFSSDPTQSARIIVGATYFNDDAFNGQDFYLALGAGGAALVVDQIVSRWVDTEAYSLFADGELDIADGLTLIAGIRYSDETKDFTANNRVSFCIAVAPPACVPAVPAMVPDQSNSASWDDFSPRFGIRYEPNDDLLLYGTVTRGFKSGGFNIQNPSNPFNPETVWSYEVGVRATLFDGLVQANASAFYYDYSDLQVNQLDDTLQVVIDNASEATLYGLDLSLLARPADGFQIGTNISLLESEYGDLVLCNDRIGACPGAGTGPQYVNIEGNTLPQAPGFSALFFADYTIETGIGSISFHGDAYRRSRTYYTQFEDSFASQKPYWLLNARATLTTHDERWSLAVWVHNLTDTLIRDGINISGTPPLDDNQDVRIVRYAAPRTFGATVGFSF